MASSDGNGTSSSTESQPVVFMKSGGSAADDIWDDTALIEAYDRAVGLTYDAVNAAIRDSGDELQATKTSRVKTGDESIKHKKKTRRAGRRIKKWKPGDLCLAPYSEDGEYYDALVVSVNSGNGRCSVEFLGYGEVEDVPLSSVHKRDDDDGEETVEDDAEVEPDTPTSRVQQRAAIPHDHGLAPGSSGLAMHSPIPSLAPPPPPAFANLPASSDQEALSSMLMSWYMSGYHTGYYQALQDARKKKGRKGGGADE